MDTPYKQIERAIRQYREFLDVGNNVMEEEVRHAIRWVMRDNPDIFWFVHQYHFDKDKGIVSFRYRCSPERSAIIQESIDDVVEKDFQIVYVRTLPQSEQVAYVYKWMLAYSNYNTNSAYNQNIDSVFVRRNSVCTGYAKAAQYLFKLLGIESRLVFGRLNNDKEDDGRHCWNTVNIEGHYYHLDVCLGDLALEDILKKAGAVSIQRYGDYNYNCFCVSTEEILKTRSIEDVESLPLCDSTLPTDEVERLSHIEIKERDESIGCLLTHIGSSADIYLCTRDKDVVLKKFRESNTQKCVEEYGYMDRLRGCMHLLQLNRTYSDVRNNTLAVEQSTPIVDLFCSHYYHPTLNGVLRMIKDITLGWQECQQRGILYRDIHVCNVYKANDGTYKLGDFGSCTYEICGLRGRVGNPWFMSPETYISGQFDERSAVYSITAVLYFVLNGLRPPFVNGNNEEEALRRKMNGEPLPEPLLLHSFPKDLAEVIMTDFFARGSVFYPSKRIQTCKELLHVIDVLRSNLNSKSVELRFVQQDIETILDNKTIPDVCIPRDIHHRFAYGEEVERMAVTALCSNSQEDIKDITTTATPTNTSGCIEEEVDRGEFGEESSMSMLDGVENYCRTMGIPETSSEKNVKSKSSKITCSYRECINGHIYDPTIFGEQCPFCSEPRKNMGYCQDDSLNKPSPVPPPTKSYAPRFAPPSRGNRSYTKPSWHPEEITYLPHIHNPWWKLLKFWGRKQERREVCTSVFAPSEVKRGRNMIVQVFLHLAKEEKKVISLAKEAQHDAIRKGYKTLDYYLKVGDVVKVTLTVNGLQSTMFHEEKSILWKGHSSNCEFRYVVPKDFEESELSCELTFYLDGSPFPIGEMIFTSTIRNYPRELNAKMTPKTYRHVFISYAHKDEKEVELIVKALRAIGASYFYDKLSLSGGDVFEEVIIENIDKSDLFVLCWSKNSAESNYVRLEVERALPRAYPQVKPRDAAGLKFYPISIEPVADLPDYLKGIYHFESLNIH